MRCVCFRGCLSLDEVPSISRRIGPPFFSPPSPFPVLNKPSCVPASGCIGWHSGRKKKTTRSEKREATFAAACPLTLSSLPPSVPCTLQPKFGRKRGEGGKGGKASCSGTPIRSVQDRGKGGMEISESNVTSRCKSCVQWAKPPSAGRSTMQLIDGSRFCCRWRLSTTTTTTTPSHSQSKSPLSQGRETGEAHRRNKSPLPPLPAVGSPAARLASFQEFAVRLLHHLLPPPPPTFSPWLLRFQVCSLDRVRVCRRARLPYRRDSRATRAPFRDGVCLPVLSGRLARRLDCTCGIKVLWS